MLVQRVDERLSLFEIGYGSGFSDFETQRRRGQTGGGNFFLYEVENIVVGERLSREVQ